MPSSFLFSIIFQTSWLVHCLHHLDHYQIEIILLVYFHIKTSKQGRWLYLQALRGFSNFSCSNPSISIWSSFVPCSWSLQKNVIKAILEILFFSNIYVTFDWHALVNYLRTFKLSSSFVKTFPSAVKWSVKTVNLFCIPSMFSWGGILNIPYSCDKVFNFNILTSLMPSWVICKVPHISKKDTNMFELAFLSWLIFLVIFVVTCIIYFYLSYTIYKYGWNVGTILNVFSYFCPLWLKKHLHPNFPENIFFSNITCRSIDIATFS